LVNAYVYLMLSDVYIVEGSNKHNTNVLHNYIAAMVDVQIT